MELQLCKFVAHLEEDVLQFSSIKGYLSAIRRLQILGGMGDPFVASWPLLEAALHGVKLRRAKSKESRPRTRMPVTPTVLHNLRGVWEKEGQKFDNIMLWAACCMCFFGFLRSGEVCVPSMKEYDAEQHLSVGDVALDSVKSPSLVRVSIKASKTDPFRRGVNVFLGKTNNDLCPVAAVGAYLACHGSKPGLFFIFQSSSPLSREMFVRRVRAARSEAGVEATQYSGHSFRIGAATVAAAVRIEDCMIKALGRWDSAAYLSYIHIPRERLAAVSGRLAQ